LAMGMAQSAGSEVGRVPVPGPVVLTKGA
jgi:hypothetical protein